MGQKTLSHSHSHSHSHSQSKLSKTKRKSKTNREDTLKAHQRKAAATAAAAVKTMNHHAPLQVAATHPRPRNGVNKLGRFCSILRRQKKHNKAETTKRIGEVKQRKGFPLRALGNPIKINPYASDN